VGIPVYGTEDYTFTIRGIYEARGGSVDNQTMYFHWKYADERSIQPGLAGWFVVLIDDADRAPEVSSAIDTKFANSPFETKTDTEQQFQASLTAMFGNLSLLLGSIGLAVIVTTLFVAANTMAMSVRERTTEIAVMRTLGFPARMIFLFIAGEGVLMAVIGGVIGAALAWLTVNSNNLAVPGGLLPNFGVTASQVGVGLGLSALIGVLASVIPATMASRLKIVDALRRVA
jgi:putative ABC transport system permease protein